MKYSSLPQNQWVIEMFLMHTLNTHITKPFTDNNKTLKQYNPTVPLFPKIHTRLIFYLSMLVAFLREKININSLCHPMGNLKEPLSHLCLSPHLHELSPYLYPAQGVSAAEQGLHLVKG